jgi:hypothetical protein
MIPDENERQENTNKLVQELDRDFTARFGYSDCRLLTGVDLKTDEGQQDFSIDDTHSRVCEKCVSACVSWLNKNL